jgi:predicted metal-dependent phosphotriesterase family hydrolase
MPTVESTLGPIQVDKLGWINAHDHVILDGGYTTVKEPDFKLDNVEKSVEEVGYWKAAGGGAIVDAQPFGCGRNMDKLITVSQTTSIPVVVPTGFQHRSFYLPDHWQYKYSVEEIADLIIQECLEGCDRNGYEGPLVRRSTIKAGFIKVGADYQHLAPNTRRLIQAVGLAHQTTGRPILAHTEMGTALNELLDALEAAGVSPDRVMLCHTDRNPDFYLHRRVAQRGAYVQFDTPGRVKYQPEHLVVDLMRRLFDAGLGNRILLGGDTARRTYWRSYGGGPGLDYLLTQFTPRLRDAGFNQAELEQVWHHNPVAWLTGA